MEVSGQVIAPQQLPLFSPCGISSGGYAPRIVPRSLNEERLDREEAFPALLGTSVAGRFPPQRGGLDHPELERAAGRDTRRRPRCGKGRLLEALVCHGAPVAEAPLKEARSGTDHPRHSGGPAWCFGKTSQRPGVRVVSVFSRTLGRIGGRGGPPRRGLNLWVLALQGSPVQARMVEAGGVEPPSEAPERRDSPRSVRTCFFSRRVFRSGRPGAAANLKLSGRLFRWRRRPQPGFRVKRRGAPDRLPGARHG